MIEITLTKGYVAIVDDEDADLARFEWQALTGDKVYAQRGAYKDKTIVRLMHRIILGRMLGRELEDHEMVDHIHGLTLDNRRSELRLATIAQNNSNRDMGKNNKSGYKGVSWSKHAKKWRASICLNSKPVNLGYFDTTLDAHRAYCEAAVERDPVFANFGSTSPFTPADFMEQQQAA